MEKLVGKVQDVDMTQYEEMERKKHECDDKITAPMDNTRIDIAVKRLSCQRVLAAT